MLGLGARANASWVYAFRGLRSGRGLCRGGGRLLILPSAPPLSALGRILLALIFVRAGISKLGTIAATSANMTSRGIPYAHALVWGAVALELVGGLMLIAGLWTRVVAFLYFFYVLALAVIFHPYWLMSGAEAHAQQNSFFEHLAIMGGLLYVVAFGAGLYSIDALIRRRPAVPQPATYQS